MCMKAFLMSICKNDGLRYIEVKLMTNDNLKDNDLQNVFNPLLMCLILLLYEEFVLKSIKAKWHYKQLINLQHEIFIKPALSFL